MDGAPRYVWYGDDFTGASDTLATVAGAGLRACLFLAPPTPAQRERVGALDALGIAGTARSLTPGLQREELAPVAAFFETLQPAVTHYKCCSTYDSAPAIGNLRQGLQALRRAAHTGPAMVLGGQPSLGRYCAFGELYATAGHDAEVHRIDRHPTMSRHPVTPMHEADLRRHLGTQGLAPMALVDLRLLDAGDAAGIDRVVETHAADGGQAVLFDATRGEHLLQIGQSWWRRADRQPLLVLGASSVAQALIAAWPHAFPPAP
ncbi:MAG TPA: four-carbon acid sugar kinase family protein, partial [Rubrivivax sp.]